MGWFYRADDQSEIGPVTTSIIRKLVEIGKITPTTMMRREGTDRWFKAKRVKGLFGRSEEPGSVATATAEPAAVSRRRARESAPLQREFPVAGPPASVSPIVSPGTARALLALVAILSLVVVLVAIGRGMTMSVIAANGRGLDPRELLSRVGCTAWISFVIAVAGLALPVPRRTD